MKKILTIIVCAAVLIIALLVSPQDLYYSYRAEKEIMGMAYPILKAVGNEDAAIEGIEYLGGKIYLLETDGNNFLIRRVWNGSSINYEIYPQHEMSITRFR